MTKRMIFLVFLLALIVSLGIFDKTYGQANRSSNKGDDSAAEKLDEILSNQKDIIARLEDIRTELGIVKIRASR